MRRAFHLIAAAVFGVLLATAAPAMMLKAIVNGPVSTPAASYTGPGNVTGAAMTAWYSCTRGYNATVATALASACDLRRPSDDATCTMKLAAGGGVDIAVGTPCGGSTVTAWLNNDSSCTGSIATTVLTVTSCTKGNLAKGLPITDANITAGTFIKSLGTGTGDVGTYNVNISQTAASATFTAPGYAFISKAYDQTANNACDAATTCNVSNATAAQQPKLILSGCGAARTLPCAQAFTGLSMSSTNNFTPATGISSLSLVMAREISLIEAGEGIWSGGGKIQTKNSLNTWILNNINGTGSLNGTANDLLTHAANAVITNVSATSVINIDGTETNSGDITGGTTSSVLTWPSSGGNGQGGPVSVPEGGFKDNTAWSSTVYRALCANQAAYYGTTVGANCS